MFPCIILHFIVITLSYSFFMFIVVILVMLLFLGYENHQHWHEINNQSVFVIGTFIASGVGFNVKYAHLSFDASLIYLDSHSFNHNMSDINSMIIIRRTWLLHGCLKSSCFPYSVVRLWALGKKVAVRDITHFLSQTLHCETHFSRMGLSEYFCLFLDSW